jgi:hypothetical protein
MKYLIATTCCIASFIVGGCSKDDCRQENNQCAEGFVCSQNEDAAWECVEGQRAGLSDTGTDAGDGAPTDDLSLSCDPVAMCAGGSTPTITILSPSPEQELELVDGLYTLPFLIETAHVCIEDHFDEAPVECQGHFHLFLDGTYIGQPIASKVGSINVSSLGPGEHTFRVELHNNDHTAYPDVPRQNVTFHNLQRPGPGPGPD